MAKITITFEDIGEKVKVTADPTFEMMMKKNLSGGQWTSAEGYALFALNQIREESKRRTPTKIIIPKLGRFQ